jgi:hypothetical protein
MADFPIAQKSSGIKKRLTRLSWIARNETSHKRDRARGRGDACHGRLVSGNEIRMIEQVPGRIARNDRFRRNGYIRPALTCFAICFKEATRIALEISDRSVQLKACDFHLCD